MNREVLKLFVLLWPAVAAGGEDAARVARAPVAQPAQVLLTVRADELDGTPFRLRAPYDPARDYGAERPADQRCAVGRVYWARGGDGPPDCTPEHAITDFPCEAGTAALAARGVYHAARAAQWRTVGASGYWAALASDHEGAVECRADRGSHGSEPATAYAAHAASGPWTSDATLEIDWDAAPLGEPYRFYAANYLDYLAVVPAEPATQAFWEAAFTAALAGTGLTPASDGEPVACQPLASVSVTTDGVTLTQGGSIRHWPLHWPALPEAVMSAALGSDAMTAAPFAVSPPTIGAGSTGGRAAAYVALSAAALDSRWHGNVLRLELAAGDTATAAPVLLGAGGRRWLTLGQHAIADDVVDLWSDTTLAPLSGGAASVLPAPEQRRVYADLDAGRPLTDATNRLDASNDAVTAAALGLAAESLHTRESLIAWALGVDSLRPRPDGTLPRRPDPFGDPGTTAPLLVIHATDQQTVLVATRDGWLHALESTTGRERWAFAPRAALARLSALATPHTTPRRDTAAPALRLHRHDANGDGRLDRDAGDHAWVLLGADGPAYYGLDVTDADAPRLLWRIDRDAWPGLGEVLVAPVISRLRIAATQSPGRWVAWLTSGTHPDDDVAALAPARRGDRELRLIDAASGTTLWSMAGLDVAADVTLASLAHALPSAPQPIDLDGDDQPDRVYLLDLAGQLFRIDLRPGNDAASLATAQLAWQLGSAGSLASAVEQRRYFATPDVAVLRDAQGRRVLAVAFGSGWRSQPRHLAMTDEFVSLREPLEAVATSTGDEDDLALIDDLGTAGLPATARGWRITLPHRGEKIVTQSLTAGHRHRYVTYTPVDPAEPCGAPRGVVRTYERDAVSGRRTHRVIESPDVDEPLAESAASALPSGTALLRAPASEDCGQRACLPSWMALDVALSTLDALGGWRKTTWRRWPMP